MKIINDCVKEGTLLLEIDGVCTDVSNIIRTLVKNNIDIKGEIASIKSDLVGLKADRNNLYNIIRSLEDKMNKCCPINPPQPPQPPVRPNPIDNFSPIYLDILNQYEELSSVYNYRTIARNRMLYKGKINPMPVKNQDYYSEKEKAGLRALSKRYKK
jgi:hypothetical protein